MKRGRELADLLRAYKVLVDGVPVGVVRSGQLFEFDVADGPHEMQLRLDWCESNLLTFVADGSPLGFECGSNYAGWRAFRGVRHALGAGADYLWLRAAPPGSDLAHAMPPNRSAAPTPSK
ncbi:MAG: hypothetical protein JNL87_17135 [Burkholderiaceae bacterium]|nr:hypothetical protein [Burkholderiaceae bacterium]